MKNHTPACHHSVESVVHDPEKREDGFFCPCPCTCGEEKHSCRQYIKDYMAGMEKLLAEIRREAFAEGKVDGETFNESWYLAGIQKAMDVLPTEVTLLETGGLGSARGEGYNTAIETARKNITNLLRLTSLSKKE